MKTIGRILVILAAFGLVMGITYMIVNAASPSTGSAAQQSGEGLPQFRNDERPVFPGGEPAEFGGEGPGGGWMFGVLKNTGVVAVIVVTIVGLQSLRRRKPVPVPVRGTRAG